MKQVMFRTTSCGPDGSFDAGKVYQLDDAAAAPFVAGGYAHEVRRSDDGKSWIRVSPTVPVPATPPVQQQQAKKNEKPAAYTGAGDKPSGRDE